MGSTDQVTGSKPKRKSTMTPVTKKTNGREFVNAAAAAALCGVETDTFQWYVRTGKPESNPAPGHDHIDNRTGQRMYAAKAVRDWHRNRPGRGNWGGIGAKARHKGEDQPTPEPAP